MDLNYIRQTVDVGGDINIKLSPWALVAVWALVIALAANTAALLTR
jgi:hypothetical protein